MRANNRIRLGWIGTGLLTLTLSGCSNVHTDLYLLPDQPSSTGLWGELTRPDAARIGRGQLVIEYSPDLDRVTLIGVRKGPNLLHTVGLEREPAEDGAYTFYGGGYTWVAPQGGQHGWTDADGELSEWPPDPAMDSGPSVIVGRTSTQVVVENPISRSGLRQRKSIGLAATHEATIEYELINESDQPLRRAHWINTAVAPGGIIALKMKDGDEVAQLYADTADGAETLSSLLGPIGDDGWAILRLSEVELSGGLKVYTDGPAEIAVWVANPDWLMSKGFWLHRSLAEPLTIEQRNELRAIGEGPVAVYLNTGLELFEAELYGPVVDIEPGETAVSTEIWRVYEAPSPQTMFLSEEFLLSPQPKGLFSDR